MLKYDSGCGDGYCGPCKMKLCNCGEYGCPYCNRNNLDGKRSKRRTSKRRTSRRRRTSKRRTLKTLRRSRRLK